jgi:hypothetical protein
MSIPSSSLRKITKGNFSIEVNEKVALSCCSQHDAPNQTYIAIKDKLEFEEVKFR